MLLKEKAAGRDLLAQSQKVIEKHSGRCWGEEERCYDYFALVLI